MASPNADVERGTEIEMDVKNEEEVKFIQPNHDETKNEPSIESKIDYSGLLTKDDLLKLEKNEPVWRRVRIVLFALFWVLWAGLLAAAIIIIVVTPKCPHRPDLKFWEKKTGYWLDPFAFKDSNSDQVGDFKGIVDEIDYLKSTLGAEMIILDSIFKGQFSGNSKTLGLVTNFTDVDPILGNLGDFINLLKVLRKKGMEVVLTINLNFVSMENPLANLFNQTKKDLLQRLGVEPACKQLDLSNDEVVKEIQGIIRYWLTLGVNGFLLEGTGFYQVNSEDIPPPAPGSNASNWYDVHTSKSLINNGTLTVVKRIREVMNEVMKKTDKPRALIVEMGNVGMGLTSGADPIFYLVGEDAAHLAVSREFVKDRGWKKAPMDNSLQPSSVANYLLGPKTSDKQIALTTATSTDVRYKDLIAIASTFLLRGTPLIYYGSEFGLQYTAEMNIPQDTQFYPRDKQPLIVKTSETSSLANHLVMRWDSDGSRFSGGVANKSKEYELYVTNSKSLSTVHEELAVGQGVSTLQLYKKLAKLRTEPSILWGNVKLVGEPIVEQDRREEIFVLSAAGFPKFIVVLINDKTRDRVVLSFKDICADVVPKLVYPANTFLPEGEKVSTERINIRINKSASVHVFACAA